MITIKKCNHDYPLSGSGHHKGKNTRSSPKVVVINNRKRQSLSKTPAADVLYILCHFMYVQLGANERKFRQLMNT